MDYHIDINDWEELLSRGKDRAWIEGDKVSRAIQTSIGKALFINEPIRNELSVFESHYKLTENIQFTGRGNEPLLELQFNLSPEDIFYKNNFSSAETVPPMSGNLIYDAENTNAKIKFAKEISYHTFDVHLPANMLMEYAGENKCLDRLLEHIRRGHSQSLSSHPIRISPLMISIINDIKNCAYSGLVRKIYQESKILELLALSIDYLENQPLALKLTAYEKKRILEVAQLIRENVACPYTIVDLANLAGINQTKLKQGFKQLTGSTIFGYLQEIRMKQAKRYLLDTNLSIQEISNMSGYSNLSNFSLAFKKVFGVSPSILRKDGNLV